MKKAALVLLGLAVLLGAAEWTLRRPFLRTPSPFEDAERGRVTRSRFWRSLTPFDVRRDPQTSRAVWMGASTIAGVPYRSVVSPPAWLQHVLDWRGVEMEVVPLSAPGLTSEGLRRLFPFALELSPDVIVVTTGHNEYLYSSRLLAPSWWRELQLVQRTASLVGLGPLGEERLPTPEHDFDHAAIATAFRDDLAAMQSMADAAGVALLVTIPICNLRDYPPILGDDPRLPEDADGAFARGRELLASGQAPAAYEAFVAARDRDRWPHRATSRLVSAVRAAVRRTVPVDVTFNEASLGGIPGDDLFADHCHPNVEGQRLLAGAVADAIEDTGLVPASGRRGQVPELEAGLQALGVRADELTQAMTVVARGYVGMALISGRDGEMAQLADRLLAAASGGHDDAGELQTSRALLALLRGDVQTARKALDVARRETPASLESLQSAYERYPWVRAVFERQGLRLEDGEIHALD